MSRHRRKPEKCYMADFVTPIAQRVTQKKNSKFQIKERAAPFDDEFALIALVPQESTEPQRWKSRLNWH
jgi:hypothetical protein